MINSSLKRIIIIIINESEIHLYVDKLNEKMKKCIEEK